MEARAVVLEYLRRIPEVTSEVVQQTSASTGGDDLGALVRAVLQGRVPRERKLPSGLEYYVHGVGCLITDRDGAVIDVDLDRERPLLRFDTWRVRRFATSIGLDGLTESMLKAAMEELVAESLLTRSRSDPGSWYIVPGVASM